MTRRPKPLTEQERIDLAREARRLADELEASYAPAVQRLLADTMDDTYPARAAGTAPMGNGGTGELTTVEAKALTRERAVHEAETICIRQHLALLVVRALTVDLRGLRPGRPVEAWPCGHLKAGDNRYSKRCLECGTGPTELLCENEHCLVSPSCGKVSPGGRLRRVVAMDQGGRELKECDRCYKYRIRNHGATWGGTAVDQLALRDGLVTAGGTFHTG